VSIVNRIGEPEQERLGLYSEEMGEAQQVVGKIFRHGIDSHHPDRPGLSNAQLLEWEAGHVLAAIDLLVACGTLDREALYRSKLAKLKKLRSWLHCGTNLDAVDELIVLEEKLKASRNHQEAIRHNCDGTNIAQAEDGTFYCAHCGWNDPKKGAQAWRS
jgi:hypothetical protein